MDTYVHKTMASIASLEKIEINRSQEFMLSEARLKFLKKMIILGPKTAILGPQFCRSLVLGPHFWSGGAPGGIIDCTREEGLMRHVAIRPISAALKRTVIFIMNTFCFQKPISKMLVEFG